MYVEEESQIPVAIQIDANENELPTCNVQYAEYIIPNENVETCYNDRLTITILPNNNITTPYSRHFYYISCKAIILLCFYVLIFYFMTKTVFYTN